MTQVTIKGASCGEFVDGRSCYNMFTFKNMNIKPLVIKSIRFYARIDAYINPTTLSGVETGIKLMMYTYDKFNNNTRIIDTLPKKYITSSEVQYTYIEFDLSNYAITLDTLECGILNLVDQFNYYTKIDKRSTPKNIYIGTDKPYPNVIDSLFEGFFELTIESNTPLQTYEGGYYVAETKTVEPVLPIWSVEPHQDMSWYINQSILDGYPIMRWMKDGKGNQRQFYVVYNNVLLPVKEQYVFQEGKLLPFTIDRPF